LVIGRRTLGLPNVILGRPLFPELLQRDVTAANIVKSVRRIVADRASFAQAVTELQATMGPPGASQRAAQELVGMMR
jgi:lipid-A-disaccharide synthase